MTLNNSLSPNVATQIKDKLTTKTVQKPSQHVLEVDKSVSGKSWLFSDVDARKSLMISQKYNLSELLSSLIVSRKVDFSDISNFLEPSLKKQLPDPYRLKDMEKAVKRIVAAIENNEKIAIFGDYDVDGATSSALFKLFFKSIGKDIVTYIPDRMKEGYGPNSDALLKLKNEQEISLLITVDCGITSFKPLKIAKDAGLDVIILDHHVGEVNEPDAVAIVNPNRFCESGEFGYLAAVGVVFLTIIAINRLLRQKNWYKNHNITEPKLLRWLDIVALGTVCDVVPLRGVNRAFVSQGLKIMAMQQNLGLRTMSEVASIEGEFNTFHLGFLLGPRINAGGRVGESSTGVNLLATDNIYEAKELAHRLNFLNQERREIEKSILEQAIEQIETNKENLDDWCLFVEGKNWHIGVIGIVASRLKEKYSRPVCVVSFDDMGEGKASARSVRGVDLGAAIISARQKKLLVAGGGHKMAAGFTVMHDSFLEFKKYVRAHIKKQCGGKAIIPSLKLDAIISASAANIELIKDIEKLAPFGTDNPEPKIALANVKIISTKIVGENHIQCLLKDSAVNHSAIRAIAFRAIDTKLGELLLNSQNKVLHLAGNLNINRWGGNEYVNFQIIDAVIA